MLTLSWYKPCCFSNANYFVIILTWFWSLWQQGHLQPHSKSKAWHLSTQLYLAAINNIWKEVFLFPFLRVIAACKTKVKLKRLSICYHFQKFIQSFQCMRDSTINLENYSGMRSCLFMFESEISLTPANTLEYNFYSRMHAVTDYSFCKKEGEKENEWSYSSFSIFFLSKPWSLLKSKFSKVFMMILDDVANRHLFSK